jgi:hypothetical protein
MGFFPEQAISEGLFQPYNPMRHVVAKLSPSAKQAMYAASKNGLIIRGRWSDGNGNGCAFNKAGENVGREVFNTSAAARLFKMDEADVDHFIRVWDNLDCNDIEANRYLVEAIEQCGTHTPIRGGRRVIRGYAYKSQATKWAEELQSGDLTVDMIPGCEEVAALLSSCGV